MPSIARYAHLGHLALALLLPWLCAAGCATPQEPIEIAQDRQVTVFNRTEQDWVDLEIRVNRYYVVPVPRLAAGGRFDLPVGRLQGGFGRYFDPARENIQQVEVKGTARDGTPVRLEWRAS